MDQAGGNDGQRVPWASLLDPKANARALAEVQAMGLRAAGDLVERLVRSVDGEPDPSVAERVEGDDDSRPDADSGEIAGLVQVWMDFLRQTAESFGRVNGRAQPGGSPEDEAEERAARVDLSLGTSTGRVQFTVAADGTTVGDPAEVWLHNGTGTPVGGLALRCFELRTSHGAALAATVGFDPPAIVELPPRSSRGVVVHVVCSCALVPGRYRGAVQAEGAPDVWLPIEVVVEAPS